MSGKIGTRTDTHWEKEVANGLKMCTNQTRSLIFMAKGEQNKLSFSKVAQKLREGTPCELQDGGALFLILTGKNRGRWEY